MEMTVRDVARILAVAEKTVYRWIAEESLPAYPLQGQYRFNRTEVLEWATSRQMRLPPSLFQELETRVRPLPGLPAALEAGGIFHGLASPDKPSALRAVVEALKLPDPKDAEFILGLLLARERLGSTAVGDGVAIPHVRCPIVLRVARPRLSLGFLERPIDFDAPDGRPVYALFTLVSPTARAHLHLLSRLAFALRDPGFRSAVVRKGSREEILAEARRLDADVGKAPEAAPPAGE